MSEFSKSIIQLQKLSSKDHDEVSEIIAKCLTCKSAGAYQQLTGDLGRLFPFQHWAGGIFELQNTWEMTDNYFIQTNYPERFVQFYRELKLQFVDFVMINNFSDESFGELQLWSKTYKKIEDMKGAIDPEIYKKHLEFLKFVKDWDILQEGYSIGYRSYNITQKGNYGSIFSIADNIKIEGRTETILKVLVPHLHQAILNVWLSQD